MAWLLNNIIGHKSQVESLLRSKKSGHLPHALLFSGPSGIGKKKTAWAFAQALLCENQKAPSCGKCPSCSRVERGTSQDMLFIEPEGLYIKLQSVRQILQFVSLQSFAPHRVIIMDSAHQMNLASANSLLKILEEPPPKVYFILVSSQPQALPVTVRSRVQVLRFCPLSLKELQTVAQEAAFSQKDTAKQKTKAQKPPSFAEKTSFIDPKEQWILKAAQGSMDNLQKWIGNQELRQKAFFLLKQAVQKKELCSFGELADLVKNREQALFVCLCWGRAIRDACVSRFKSSKQEEDFQDQKQLLSALNSLPFALLSDFFDKTIQLERDLKGNADSPLAFDNIFMTVKPYGPKEGRL